MEGIMGIFVGIFKFFGNHMLTSEQRKLAIGIFRSLGFIKPEDPWYLPLLKYIVVLKQMVMILMVLGVTAVFGFCQIKIRRLYQNIKIDKDIKKLKDQCQLMLAQQDVINHIKNCKEMKMRKRGKFTPGMLRRRNALKMVENVMGKNTPEDTRMEIRQFLKKMSLEFLPQNINTKDVIILLFLFLKHLEEKKSRSTQLLNYNAEKSVEYQINEIKGYLQRLSNVIISRPKSSRRELLEDVARKASIEEMQGSLTNLNEMLRKPYLSYTRNASPCYCLSIQHSSSSETLNEQGNFSETSRSITVIMAPAESISNTSSISVVNPDLVKANDTMSESVAGSVCLPETSVQDCSKRVKNKNY